MPPPSPPPTIWSEFSLLCNHSSVDREAPGKVSLEVRQWKTLYILLNLTITSYAIYNLSSADFLKDFLYDLIHVYLLCYQLKQNYILSVFFVCFFYLKICTGHPNLLQYMFVSVSLSRHPGIVPVSLIFPHLQFLFTV